MAGETYNENSDVLAILFDLDNTLIQTRNGDSRACNKILDQQYGLPSEAAAESATNFLRAFRARPDDDSFAIDEWPAHFISAEWLKLRFHYLSLTPDVIHLLETLSS
ncbi:hypothetical protein MSG28_006994 [Choristoneura fumiferana]|uniref:Uncharacterized protein n=1 Tax=Choristoneura fumiferana TaxID=7141 RepID=A0ACC0JM08_CHOFU|nr:hypothetical protein MSG28_006994 [Choristoneura fumiferana]